LLSVSGAQSPFLEVDVAGGEAAVASGAAIAGESGATGVLTR